jgi:sirohydrochlorin ferrochelatase/(2Fe-2S) ferredoxin
LIVGHGSRIAGANQEFEALVAAYRELHPEHEVRLGYIELAAPSLDDALTALIVEGYSGTVVLLPLFLFQAGHAKNDLPLAIARARLAGARMPIVIAQALGVSHDMVQLYRGHLQTGLEATSGDAVLIPLGRGASDADANSDFCKVARLASEGLGAKWALPCFIGITEPQLEATLELAGRLRPDHIVIAPYFLFAGRLLDKVNDLAQAFRARYPWVRVTITPHLGVQPQLIRAAQQRVTEALSGERALPCENCQYRVSPGAVVKNVKGLQALLWSVRHSFTHTQAVPHVHAHRPLTRHVLVCGNADCADRGSLEVLAQLRRLVKRAGRSRDIRVTKTHCMGRCGEGPALAVYPDGIWYRSVCLSDAEELVSTHLIKGQLVGRLVDQIMQQ